MRFNSFSTKFTQYFEERLFDRGRVDPVTIYLLLTTSLGTAFN